MNGVKRYASALMIVFLAFMMLLSAFGIFAADVEAADKGTDYYISSSEGDDGNSGTSKSSPWKSFANINSRVLEPGDCVYLKRGDVWNERLTIFGSGEEKNRIVIGSYGDSNDMKPIISLNQGKDDICMVISDIRVEKPKVKSSQYITVEELDLRDARIGLFVRASVSTENKNLIIRNCDFSNILCDELLNTISKDLESLNGEGAKPFGNLPYVNSNNLEIEETGGGAGECTLPTAIRFSGRSGMIFDDVLIENIVMDNCIVGIEGIRMSNVKIRDVICSGSYAGIVRFSAGCSKIDISSIRLLGGSEKYTIFAGTCGGFIGDVQDVEVTDSEFSYEYNLGENDGCGFDFEYKVTNVAFKNNVMHHNDSGGILMMQLPGGKEGQHDNLAIENNLFYSNLVAPKNAGYNYDIILYNQGSDNVFLRNNFFFTRKVSKAGNTKFYGNLGDRENIYGTVVENNELLALDDYRTRFSFNKDGNGEGFAAYEGSFAVEGGAARLTASGKRGAMLLGLPVNGFCYDSLILNVASGEGTVYAQYTMPDGSTSSTKTLKINGSGEYLLDLSDEEIKGYIKDLMLIYQPKQTGGTMELDSAEFTADFSAAAVKKGDNTVWITFEGESVPMLRSELIEGGITVDGYTVTDVKRLNYNTVSVTTSETINKAEGLNISVKADMFIEYFADIINGLDMGRTPADDAKLLGCELQEYKYSGTLELTTEKPESSSGCGNCAE